MDDMSQRVQVEKQVLEDLIFEKAKQPIGCKNKIWVVIDEAQKCPLIFDQVKILQQRTPYLLYTRLGNWIAVNYFAFKIFPKFSQSRG